ncbi:uncharacterized protein PHALS_01825 [Plasmopara halstedii]|uniref:Uncharacterized protein n=1 Tax=Plasmopara halstedii TaxID=4781 RepID=A0A0P1AVM2_PLAHL|nr:uncharacterized protein PHALS_01825 [Plasmopara halstedii]CEG45536.1 hypothetical protein PHALS_01825 [Plasmopara halstedii]|eukprot:XP_024581905.1 hypothetical protein PHALS_01825 [Plasmopara halstedii]
MQSHCLAKTLSCSDTKAGVPVDSGFLIANSSDLVQSVSSIHETDDSKDIEARVPVLEKSALDHYNAHVEELGRHQLLENALKTSEMEAFYKFCVEYNSDTKNKDKLSLIEPLSKIYKDSFSLKKLYHLSMAEDHDQEIIRMLINEQLDTLVKEEFSLKQVFDLLEFDDSLATVVRNGKYDYFFQFWMSRASHELTDKSLVDDFVWGKFIEFLTKHFGGDGILLWGIEQNPELSSLREHLFEIWDKLPLDAVWDRLRFGDIAYLEILSGRLAMFHKHAVKSSPTATIKKFIQTYGEEKVTESIATASLVYSNSFASTLHRERLDLWKAEGYSVKTVFDVLKFHNDDEEYLVIYKLETLTNYIWSISNEAKVAATHEIENLASSTSKALTTTS